MAYSVELKDQSNSSSFSLWMMPWKRSESMPGRSSNDILPATMR
nr:MAG TPA_asm: hypothetical protein [Caudoviricetes sp.]